jgi:hypothetical protein
MPHVLWIFIVAAVIGAFGFAYAIVKYAASTEEVAQIAITPDPCEQVETVAQQPQFQQVIQQGGVTIVITHGVQSEVEYYYEDEEEEEEEEDCYTPPLPKNQQKVAPKKTLESLLNESRGRNSNTLIELIGKSSEE